MSTVRYCDRCEESSTAKAGGFMASWPNHSSEDPDHFRLCVTCFTSLEAWVRAGKDKT